MLIFESDVPVGNIFPKAVLNIDTVAGLEVVVVVDVVDPIHVRAWEKGLDLDQNHEVENIQGGGDAVHRPHPLLVSDRLFWNLKNDVAEVEVTVEVLGEKVKVALGVQGEIGVRRLWWNHVKGVRVVGVAARAEAAAEGDVLRNYLYNQSVGP